MLSSKQDEVITILPTSNVIVGTDLTDIELTQIELKTNTANHDPLNYLKPFTREALKDLEKQYGKLPQELEKLVHNHSKTYWYYRGKNFVALGSNLLYLLFLINTGYEGIQSFANFFSKDVKVPYAVGQGVSIPISFIDSLFHTLLFSAHNEAVKSTIDYVHQEPWHIALKKTFMQVFTDTKQSAFNGAKFALNQTVLLSVNLTSTMTEVVDLYSHMSDVPLFLKIPIVGSILYWGNYYLKKYSNPDYYEGLNFWFNNKNHPWLIAEILRGNIAVPLQIFLQGMISTVGLRTYPFYYYLAIASKETLGFWFPQYVVLLAVTWHSLCALYPYTFNYYMSHQEKIDALLRANIDIEKLNAHIREQMEELKIDSLDETQLQKLKEIAIKDIINGEKNFLIAKMLSKYGKAFLFSKEKHQAIPLAWRTALGGYFGFECITPALLMILDAPVIMAILGIIMGVSLFTGTFLLAENKRAMDELIYQDLQQNENINDSGDIVIEIIEEKNPSSCCGQAKNLFPDFLNVTTGGANVMSTLGTQSRTPYNSPLINVAVALTAIENSINGMLFNKDKARATIQNICADITAKVSSTSGTLFNRCRKRFMQSQQNETLLPTYMPK